MSVTQEKAAPKLKFRIHFELSDGTEDSVVLAGESIEEIRDDAQKAVEVRRGTNAWSEEIL